MLAGNVLRRYEMEVAVICVSLLIYNLYTLKHATDPKDELLKAKELLD